MGWGLIIKDVYLNRVTKAELPSVLEDTEKGISDAKDRLLMLAASTPRVVESEEGFKTDWNDYARREVSEIMEELEEMFVKRHLARICTDNPEDVTEG